MPPRSMLPGMAFRLQSSGPFGHHHLDVPQAPQMSSVLNSNLRKLGDLLTRTHTHTHTLSHEYPKKTLSNLDGSTS